ncbi:hypothetical protein [Phytohabitans rumicis]|uniref:Lipoprotein n=1 Tax=Phytohabitans rumicis TaxID=1076125 RepID=A0A6V8KX24_9ACTN|nr:hypothetical protein [Phytohabitans rumicis]GFJ86396.1 hypothetical protein Prum_000380 [Phytohabitans rumicis]
MRRTLALTLACLVFAASCSDPARSPAADPTTPAPAAPATTAGEPLDGTEMDLEGVFTPAVACETADLMYRNLDELSQEHIRAGVAAERSGDKAGVAQALAALEPLLTSTSATFADTAGKVADPVLKDALTSLSASAAKAATFTTFAEFNTLAALTAPAEVTLKRECPKAGYVLKNIQ